MSMTEALCSTSAVKGVIHNITIVCKYMAAASPGQMILIIYTHMGFVVVFMIKDIVYLCFILTIRYQLDFTNIKSSLCIIYFQAIALSNITLYYE